MSLLILLSSLLSCEKCSKEDTVKRANEHSAEIKPISSPENRLIKTAEHAALIKVMLSEGIQDQDVQRQLYLLQSSYWLSNNFLRSAKMCAFLTKRELEFREGENNTKLKSRNFVLGQYLYVTGDLEGATKALTRYISENFGVSSLQETAQTYLSAIEQNIPFESLFFEGEIQAESELLMGLRDKSFVELLDYKFDDFIREKVPCGDDACDLPIVDLSVYPYLNMRLHRKIGQYMSRNFEHDSAKEVLLHDWFSSLFQSTIPSKPRSYDTILKGIEHEGLHNKKNLKLYYECLLIRKSGVTPDVERNPLAFIKKTNMELDIKDVSSSHTGKVYGQVLPVLFNDNYSPQYRDNIYVSLWSYLFAMDRDLLEQFKLEKGYSPRVATPEYFLDLLPYQAEHPIENPMGSTRLKNAVKTNNYLRPLIASYEYIARKVTPENNDPPIFGN